MLLLEHLSHSVYSLAFQYLLSSQCFLIFPFRSLPFSLLSSFNQYLIHSSLSLPLSDIQAQEPDRISLVPLDLVVLLLSLPEEDRD